MNELTVLLDYKKYLLNHNDDKATIISWLKGIAKTLSVEEQAEVSNIKSDNNITTMDLK